MNTSVPVACVPFSFLIPCRRKSPHDPTEILVQKFKPSGSPKSRIFERSIEDREAFQLIAIALTNTGWESHSAPGDGSQSLEHEVQAEDLLSDLIRLTVTKTLGADECLVVGSTMPFYYRPVGRGNQPCHATAIPLQVVGDVGEEFVWVNPEELLVAETQVLVTPAARSEGFSEMVRQAVTLFDQNRGPDAMKSVAHALASVAGVGDTSQNDDKE